jgi:hypothetical protein
MSSGITEWEAEEIRRDASQFKSHSDLLREALVTLRHARVFIGSRERMHPTGISLYDDLVGQIEKALMTERQGAAKAGEA